jgi:hypothetical protein
MAQAFKINRIESAATLAQTYFRLEAPRKRVKIAKSLEKAASRLVAP